MAGNRHSLRSQAASAPYNPLMARIGIIGTGWGAKVQTPAFREAGLEVVAIAGHRPENTRGEAGIGSTQRTASSDAAVR